jgi:hypothetical protein
MGNTAFIAPSSSVPTFMLAAASRSRSMGFLFVIGLSTAGLYHRSDWAGFHSVPP